MALSADDEARQPSVKTLFYKNVLHNRILESQKKFFPGILSSA